VSVAPLLAALVVVGGLGVLPLVGSAYALSLGYSVVTFTALAYSWNLVSGYTGYVSLGHVAFFGVGGYTTALLVTKAQWHWLLAAVAGGLVAALVAVPAGAAMLRLRGPYFAIGMLGLARVLERLALGWDSLTHGGRGLYLPPIIDTRGVYLAAFAVLLLLIAGTFWLENSSFGLRLLAIREDETGAESLGIPTARLKLMAFVFSALPTGILGGIWAWHLSYLDPGTAFGINIELTAIVGAILGGAGTVWGPLVGGLGISLVGEALWARFPRVHLGLFGVILVVTMLGLPRGLATALMRLRALPPTRFLIRRAVRQEWRAQGLPLGRAATAPID